VQWLKRSAKQGFDKAECKLAMHYYRRFDPWKTVKNIVKCVKWLRASAGKQCEEAQIELGIVLVRNEFGLKINQEVCPGLVVNGEAQAIFKECADNGSIYAKCWLSFCLSRGVGGIQDQEKASELFDELLASNSDSPPRLYYIGDAWRFIAQYIRDQSQYRNAVRCWEMAGMNRQALFSLAECYENGNGVEKDRKAAFEKYHTAALLGYEPPDAPTWYYAHLYHLKSLKRPRDDDIDNDDKDRVKK